ARGGAAHRRVAAAAARSRRVFAHPPDVVRIADGAALTERPRSPKVVLAPHEDELGTAALGAIQQCAPDDLVRGVVAAHCVDGDLHSWVAGTKRPSASS